MSKFNNYFIFSLKILSLLIIPSIGFIFALISGIGCDGGNKSIICNGTIGIIFPIILSIYWLYIFNNCIITYKKINK